MVALRLCLSFKGFNIQRRPILYVTYGVLEEKSRQIDVLSGVSKVPGFHGGT